jgi:hypothetical protein
MNTEGQKIFQPFRQFIDSVESATHQEYLDVHGASVETNSAFLEMQEHLKRVYAFNDVDVDKIHSFSDENGQIFDCIPWNEQLAVRGTGQQLADSLSDSSKDPSASSTSSDGQMVGPLSTDKKDRFGNTMACPAYKEQETIPLRRVTLAELTSFRTLRDYNARFIDGAEHKYATVGQNVNNHGGRSYLNIWAPEVIEEKKQIFSLSQQWYAGGRPKTREQQTLEVGWTVDPQRYGRLPAFFIYWTPDGYDGRGRWNGQDGLFVPTGRHVAFGQALQPVSISDGAQYGWEMGWKLVEKRGLGKTVWSLDFQGIEVGYYPTSAFDGGQLASHATRIVYGGETVGRGSMGSGKKPNKTTSKPSVNFRKAAYQRKIRYFSEIGEEKDADLMPWQQDIGYEIDLHPMGPESEWGAFCFFGGPGQ